MKKTTLTIITILLTITLWSQSITPPQKGLCKTQRIQPHKHVDRASYVNEIVSILEAKKIEIKEKYPYADSVSYYVPFGQKLVYKDIWFTHQRATSDSYNITVCPELYFGIGY